MWGFDDPPTGGARRSATEGVKKTWGGPASSWRSRSACAVVVAAVFALPGCAVVGVAGAAAGAAISVAAAVVSAGVQVTGKVIGKTIEVVTPDSNPAP